MLKELNTDIDYINKEIIRRGSNGAIIEVAGTPVHAFANVVPLEADVSALARNIKDLGLLHPITTYKGQIIDGRRRTIACSIAGVTLKVNELSDEREYSMEELLMVAEAENATRRSLTKSQKAMVAAMMCQSGEHVRRGIPSAKKYAKDIWGVGEITYAKARYVLTWSPVMANDIFESGKHKVAGSTTNETWSMNQCWTYLKDKNAKKEHDLDPEEKDSEKSVELAKNFKATKLHADSMLVRASAESVAYVLRKTADAIEGSQDA